MEESINTFGLLHCKAQDQIDHCNFPLNLTDPICVKYTKKFFGWRTLVHSVEVLFGLTSPVPSSPLGAYFILSLGDSLLVGNLPFK